MEGYHVGSLRTVRLHKLFLSLQDIDLVDFTVVLAKYQDVYRGDDSASRVFESQMKRAPHLFAPIFDAIWMALPDSGVAFRRRGTIRYNRNGSISDRDYERDTISHWLSTTLRQLGPSRAVDLRDRAASELGSKFEITSIQPVLLMNREFVRLAPGVFGLQEQLTRLSADSTVFPGSFFSGHHCRYYVAARKAEEPINLYPGWNFNFEAQLCSWAKNNSPTDVFRSLLDVADPENWPIPEEEKRVWRTEKFVHGDYQLARAPLSVSEAKAPREADILAALAYLGTIGGLMYAAVQ